LFLPLGTTDRPALREPRRAVTDHRSAAHPARTSPSEGSGGGSSCRDTAMPARDPSRRRRLEHRDARQAKGGAFANPATRNRFATAPQGQRQRPIPSRSPSLAPRGAEASPPAAYIRSSWIQPQPLPCTPALKRIDTRPARYPIKGTQRAA